MSTTARIILIILILAVLFHPLLLRPLLKRRQKANLKKAEQFQEELRKDSIYRNDQIAAIKQSGRYYAYQNELKNYEIFSVIANLLIAIALCILLFAPLSQYKSDLADLWEELSGEKTVISGPSLFRSMIRTFGTEIFDGQFLWNNFFRQLSALGFLLISICWLGFAVFNVACSVKDLLNEEQFLTSTYRNIKYSTIRRQEYQAKFAKLSDAIFGLIALFVLGLIFIILTPEAYLQDETIAVWILAGLLGIGIGLIGMMSKPRKKMINDIIKEPNEWEEPKNETPEISESAENT